MSSERKSLTLQQKVSMALLAVMVVLAVFSYAILNAVVAPTFDELENREASTNLVRAQRALGAELANLSRLSTDWAPWDDTYLYVQGQYDSFERSNLQHVTLVDLHLNMMLFYRKDGSLQWGRILIDEKTVDLEGSGIFGTGSEQEALLTTHKSVESEVRGILRTDFGAMLLTSDPILTTAGEGPIVGTLILGRFMDATMLERLREQTEVDLTWHSIEDETGKHSADMALIGESNSDNIGQEVLEDRINSISLIRDLFNEPVLLLHATTPRNISALGAQTLSGALLMLAIAMLIVAACIWLLLRTIVVKPLESLASHITQIRKTGDLSSRFSLSRRDEIGEVAWNFDELTADLEDARESLLEQSFKAGKADTAAEVMHNIRNAMTPLINGIDRLGMVCSVTNGMKVDQATDQLADPDCDPARRAKLIDYVDAAFRHIEESHADGDRELTAVSKQARQVEAILSDQERHAVGAPILEKLHLDDVLDEAVLVIPKRKKPAVEVDMPEEISEFYVRGHRVGLLQVLGNLILNAYEAIQRTQTESGRISVSATRETIDDREMVRLVVSDTGCGFDNDKRNKIFQRGYSSKTGKMGGLGLHWCANALAAMGGRITAESTGSGQGAQFHVLLPSGHGG
jgi:two-component system NtrC family sensor kinase